VSSARSSSAWRTLREAVAASRRNRLTTTAQALAYSLFLAIPATCLVLVGLFSLLAGPEAIQAVVDRAASVIPVSVAGLLQQSLTRSAQSSTSGLVIVLSGALLALWTMSSAASTLMQGLSTAFGREDERSFLRKRILALAIVLCLVAAAALVGTLLIAGPYAERWVGDALGQPDATAWVWWLGQWPILIGALLFLFAVLLLLGPDVGRQDWRHVVPGAAVAVVAWLAASAAFAFYASRFGSYERTWGTLSAVVVTLIWLWLTSAALLFGAEINAAVSASRAERSDAANATGNGAVSGYTVPLRDRSQRRQA